MIVGCLGSMAFQVSDSTVKTLNKLQWSGSARYATHQRHGTRALTEFVGHDPEKISFEIYLSAYLEVSPMAELAKLLTYERGAYALPLVLGNHSYGVYRWNVISHKVSVQTTDAHGNVTSATVSLTLQEYLRG